MTTNRDEDLETIVRIMSGLDELEKAEPVFTPSPQWFDNLVEEHSKVIKRKLVRDLVLFLTVAFVVLFITLGSLVKVPAAYWILQIGVFAAPLYLLTAERRKRVKRE